MQLVKKMVYKLDQISIKPNHFDAIIGNDKHCISNYSFI